MSFVADPGVLALGAFRVRGMVGQVLITPDDMTFPGTPRSGDLEALWTRTERYRLALVLNVLGSWVLKRGMFELGMMLEGAVWFAFEHG